MNNSFVSIHIPAISEVIRVSFEDARQNPGVYRIFDKQSKIYENGRMVIFHPDYVEVNAIYVSETTFNPQNDAWKLGWERPDLYLYEKTSEMLSVSFIQKV